MAIDKGKRLTELKSAMLISYPFFASLWLDQMELRVGKFDATQTAGTDGKTIFFDEDFLVQLTLPECVFVMCHEICHAMWMHMDRARRYDGSMGPNGHPFNAMLWNVAGDYVINSLLSSIKCGEQPDGTLLSQAYTHKMTVDEVYNSLFKKTKANKSSGGNDKDSGAGDKSDGSGGSGNSQNGKDGGEFGKRFDDHIYKVDERSPAEWHRAVQSAHDVAKAMGKMPGDLSRVVTDLVEPKVNWKEKLRKAIHNTVGRESQTWTRLHRRRLVLQNVALPAHTGHNAGVIVVAIDTSGSIGNSELTVFLSELDDILTSCMPETVHVLAIDAEVAAETTLHAGDSIRHGAKVELKGGGGTNFIPAFEWVTKNLYDPPACLIYFTDMYGTFPDKEPVYPTIWCATTDVGAPFGDVIPCEIKT